MILKQGIQHLKMIRSKANKRPTIVDSDVTWLKLNMNKENIRNLSYTSYHFFVRFTEND